MNTRTIHNPVALRTNQPRVSLLAWIDRHARALLIALVLGWIVVVGAAAILKFQRFLMGFDLALIQQIIWNTLHGRPFETYAYDFTTNILGTDSFFVHLLMVPFYALYPNPATLLLVQTVIVGTSAIAVYLLTRDALSQRWAALAIAAVYLLYQPVLNGTLYEVRERVLAMAFVLWMLLAIHRRRYGWMIVAAVLALSNRLDTTIGVALVGVYALLLRFRREPTEQTGLDRIGWHYGLTLIAMAVAWYIFVTNIMVPRFTDRPGYLFLEHYGYLGDSPGAILANVILNPLNTLGILFAPPKLWFLLGMFLPLAFLSLLNWRLMLVMIPLYGLNLLSPRKIQWDVYHHYQGLIVPLMVLAAIFGLATITRRRLIGRWTLHLGVTAMLLGTMASHYLYGNQIVSIFKRWQPTERVMAANEIVRAVPDDVSLAVSNVLAPHVAPRREIFLLPGDDFHYVAEPLAKADYALVDLDVEGERDELTQAIAAGGWCIVDSSRDESAVRTITDALRLQAADAYGIDRATPDYLLLRREPAAQGERCDP